jgi:hypothetical protein
MTASVQQKKGSAASRPTVQRSQNMMRGGRLLLLEEKDNNHSDHSYKSETKKKSEPANANCHITSHVGPASRFLQSGIEAVGCTHSRAVAGLPPLGQDFSADFGKKLRRSRAMRASQPHHANGAMRSRVSERNRFQPFNTLAKRQCGQNRCQPSLTNRRKNALDRIHFHLDERLRIRFCKRSIDQLARAIFCILKTSGRPVDALSCF